MSDIIRIAIGTICIIIGILGCFLPILPGPLLSYGALLLLRIGTGSPSTQTLIIRFAITTIISVLDYIIPIIGTKKMGGTKWGSRGATIGLIIGIIVLPILGITLGPFGLVGIIGGPFLGAYIAEKLHGKTHAIKSALGSFFGFLAGTLLKLTIAIIMTVIFFRESIDIIKQLF